MSRQPLDALTGMRGVASLWVLVFHLRPWLGLAGAADRFAQAGYLAVDVFFVLSGFVLAYQYRGLGARPRAWLAFWWRRVARIAPLHVAITLALVAVVVARGWWGQPEYTVHGLLAQLTLTQTWSSIDATSWNEPAWSVSAEWHAYLAFPILLIFALRVRRAAIAAVLGIGLVIVPRLVADLDAIAGPSMFVRLLTAFGAGMLLARGRELGLRIPRWTAELAALGMVTAAASDLHAWVPAFGAMMIVGLATGEGPIAAALVRRRAIALGEVSYALYLVHGAAMLVLWKLAPLATTSTGTTIAALACYGALVIALTIAGHRIETLAKTWLVRRSPRLVSGR